MNLKTLLTETGDVLRRHPWIAVPFVVYAFTVSRHIGLPDSAIVIDAMREPVLSSHSCNHNLNNLIGFVMNRLIPVDNVVLKSSLTSVAYGGIAIPLLYAVFLGLGIRKWIAALGSGVFMVSHSMWWHSTVVENYALNVVFLVFCCFCVLKDRSRAAGDRRLTWLYWLFFAAGLSTFNHLQNLSLSVGAAVYLGFCFRRVKEHGWRKFLYLAGAYLSGTLPYAAVAVKDLVTSSDPADTLRWMVGGPFTGLMFSFEGWADVVRLAVLVFLQFPSFFVLLIPVGVLAGFLRNRLSAFFAFLWAVFVVNAGFFVGYHTWDQFSFQLISFACIAVLGVYGAERICRLPKTYPVVAVILLASILIPPWIYTSIPRWAENNAPYWGRRYHHIYRQYRYRYDMVGLLIDPVFHGRGTVEEFIGCLLKELPREALFIDDITTFYQILHVMEHSVSREDMDVRLIRPRGYEGWGTPVDDVVDEIRFTQRRVFLVTDIGRCADLLVKLDEYGYRSVPFDLPGGRRVYEVVSMTETGG